MSTTIPVAHDFNCPWCWIAISQAKRLSLEFDVEFEWRGFELFPEGIEWPEAPAPRQYDNDRPATPSRLDLALAAEGLPAFAPNRPQKMRTHNAHLAVEYARIRGSANALVQRLYEAHWIHGLDINDLLTIKKLAKGIIDDPNRLIESVQQNLHSDRITYFDDDAHAEGIYSVPTFLIGGNRYAEQPYSVLSDALSQVVNRSPGFYRDLNFPKDKLDRPYIVMNMAATIDGRVIVEGKSHIGSRDDLLVLRRIESQVDASLVGANTLREAPSVWYSRSPVRIVITRSMNLPEGSAYLDSRTARVIITSPTKPLLPNTDYIPLVEHAEIPDALSRLAKQYQIKSLLVEGGPIVNGQFLEQDLVDELFLTIAPCIALGNQPKTYAESQTSLNIPMNMRLVESHVWRDEVFLRYRRS
jgi:riboflavin biosynthesis pyrimidine reductase/predicted DsbA family dithiol-disulfide isomerase